LRQGLLERLYPNIRGTTVLIDRITDRIMHSKKQTWHYYGQAISKEAAVRLLMGNEVSETI